MPLVTINVPPALDSFTALSEHQAQTPSTFYDSKPILHYHAIGVKAVAYGDYVKELPFFADGPAQGEGAAVVEIVDVFISTDNVTIFNPATSIGLSIPYTHISLHATQRLTDPSDPAKKEVPGLFMQLETPPAAGDEDDTPSIIELALIPSDPESSTQALYDALTACANLVPDEDVDMEEDRMMFEGNVGYEGVAGLPGVQRGTDDGGLPPPFPGSGGWITAENMGDFMDADGNWIGGEEGGEVEELGEGAGRTRGHDEVEMPNGNGAEEETNKRARTD